jgi:hypothetical protein
VVAGAGADPDPDAVADAVADADAVAGVRTVGLAHDAVERCANVIECVEQLRVDVVDVPEDPRNVEASARLSR